MKKEQERMQEGLKRGEFRPVDNNETVNEVVSNWGAAQAMAAARGDDKYFDAPKPQSCIRKEVIAATSSACKRLFVEEKPKPFFWMTIQFLMESVAFSLPNFKTVFLVSAATRHSSIQVG
ncbi:unnamed protein product [Heligmosomoides polygyrus]|uniref:Uncharacterized protein n=1 Tax=Heligmosomoides polygyrus TaxID=6339 RepID=A0A183GIC1_HELPZ|nr:unnamed protein product [Heligmosomoides polygyrus]